MAGLPVLLDMVARFLVGQDRARFGAHPQEAVVQVLGVIMGVQVPMRVVMVDIWEVVRATPVAVVLMGDRAATLVSEALFGWW